MTDPIQRATDLAKSSIPNSLPKTAVVPPPVITDVSEKIKKLPTMKDKELIKKQLEAEVQKKKGELENKLQQEKDKKIEEMKDKLATLAPLAAGALALYLKLPILDPKVLATIAFLKAQKELQDLKQKVSKENLKKAKENFTYPIKPPTGGLPALPKVPELPSAGGLVEKAKTLT